MPTDPLSLKAPQGQKTHREPESDYISQATRDLLAAARQNDLAGLERALAQGASMEARAGQADWGVGGERPRALHVALRAGAAAAARWLLERGADPAGLSGCQEPKYPLEWCHNAELALEIMERGGYGSHPERRERCDFSRFAARPDKDAASGVALGWQKAFFARYVELGGDLESKDKEGLTAMARAAASMRVRGIAELAALGADPNALDAQGRPILREAAGNLTRTGFRTRPYKTVVELIVAGADPQRADAQGRPPHQVLKDYAWNLLPQWDKAVKEGLLERERRALKQASARPGIKRAAKKPRL